VSTAAQLARAEIERTPQEDPEPDPEPTPEPAPEPEPEPQASVGEKELRALERENDRHQQALGKMLGEDFAGFASCPLCDGGPAGFVPPFSVFPDEAAAAKGQAVYEYFEGRAEIEPPYKQATTMRTCAACEGWGQVISGARNSGHRLEQCRQCFGNGWVDRVDSLPSTPNYTPPNIQTGGTSPVPGADGQVMLDTWGRQLGHPHFGLHPDTIGR